MTKAALTASLLWLVLVSCSFAWNYQGANQERRHIALQTARSFFSQLVTERAWNASHGGVYAPVTESTQPNPYLEGPLRDIRVSDDLLLTKINPAFMTRQIGEIANEKEGVRFRITSLNPIRPANKATPREEAALRLFESGTPEVGKDIREGQQDTFFYMAPLDTTQACLRCHAKQGYKLGDVRGGISVTIPFVARVPLLAMSTGHTGIGILGVLGILFFGGRLNRAYETAKKRSVIDALTGIPNRRAFMDRVVSELGRSRRDHSPLSVILGDIDHFKLYNDNHGHQAGDECLKRVADAIRRALRRPGDFCARYGGEEFVVILPQTGDAGAALVAETIRQNIQALGVLHGQSPTADVVTISLGVASTEGEFDSDLEQLIRRADAALYLAKEQGRNQVVCSPSQPPTATA